MTGLLQGQISYIAKSGFKRKSKEEHSELEIWLLRQENSKKKFRNNEKQEQYRPENDTLLLNKIQDYFRFERVNNFNTLTWQTDLYSSLSPYLQDEVILFI